MNSNLPRIVRSDYGAQSCDHLAVGHIISRPPPTTSEDRFVKVNVSELGPACQSFRGRRAGTAVNQWTLGGIVNETWISPPQSDSFWGFVASGAINCPVPLPLHRKMPPRWEARRRQLLLQNSGGRDRCCWPCGRAVSAGRGPGPPGVRPMPAVAQPAPVPMPVRCGGQSGRHGAGRVPMASASCIVQPRPTVISSSGVPFSCRSPCSSGGQFQPTSRGGT